MRHAMAKYPHSKYFWFLDQNALIMNPELTIESIMAPKRLDAMMIRDQPIVPPDSVIKTFTHLHGDQIDFVLTQDRNGLAPTSFILKRGDWAQFFLDTYFDPLYRSYNFQKAEIHALVCGYIPARPEFLLTRYRNISSNGILLFSQS
jgi:mannan polymerase II complex MNN11 subunit